MDDFVYVIAISAIASAPRASIKSAAYKAAQDGGDLAAVTMAARKAAQEGGLTACVQVVARLAKVAGHSVDGPRKRAIAASNAAAKAEKARAIESGASDEEARASAAIKAAEAYSSELPQRMREALNGRRIPAPSIITINGGKIASVDGDVRPVLGASVEGLLRRFDAEVERSFAASAATIITSGGHVLPEVIPAKKPEGSRTMMDTGFDQAWANEPGRVVSGTMTGYRPKYGYRIELHCSDIIGPVDQDKIEGLVALLSSGKVVVPKTTIYDGAVVMASIDDLAAKDLASKATNVVSIEDAIKAALALTTKAPSKSRPKAKAKLRK